VEPKLKNLFNLCVSAVPEQRFLENQVR